MRCPERWTVSGSLGDAVDKAIELASKSGRRYRVKLRKIGQYYLHELDGTPVWDVIPY